MFIVNRLFLAILCASLMIYCLEGCQNEPLLPRTDFEELIIILTKYSNTNKRSSRSPLAAAIFEKDERAVDLLLKYGADPHPLIGKNGRVCGDSYILDAIEADSIPLVKKFIDLGVTLEIVDVGDAIQAAEMYGSKEMLEFLKIYLKS